MSESMPSTEERASLDALGARLSAESPRLSAIELDQLKRRVLVAAGAPARRPSSLRRLVAVAALSAGVLFGATGVTFGVHAIAERGDAAGAQYADTPAPVPPVAGPEVPDDNGGRTPGGRLSGVLDDRVFGTIDVEDAAPPAQPADAARQLGAGRGSLAFTGYAALPALALGLLLVAVGVALRRRSGPAHGS